MKKIEMNFLSDLHVPCTRCGGKRFNRQTLQVRFKDANVADVLAMSIDHAAEFFQNVSKLSRLLGSLQDVGLGYLHLGQASTTLSGGEAQRVKLAAELGKRTSGRTLYIFDEPTTGLHFHDVATLLSVMNRLRQAGNTLVVIEHNLDVIKTADVYTGGFSAEYGGRISSVIDIKTRDGNKKRLTGKVAASTFGGKLLLEGPLFKQKENGAGSSFILSAKTSYIDQTSQSIYSYIGDEGLPYSFLDIYGKVSLESHRTYEFNNLILAPKVKLSESFLEEPRVIIC